jgi:hypothetical protein
LSQRHGHARHSVPRHRALHGKTGDLAVFLVFEGAGWLSGSTFTILYMVYDAMEISARHVMTGTRGMALLAQTTAPERPPLAALHARREQ